jgi:hypothetical protein
MSNKFIELNVNHDNFEPAFDEAEMRLRIHSASSSAALSTLMERRFFGTSHALLHPIDSSAESEVNKHEKTQLNLGGLVDPKYIDGRRAVWYTRVSIIVTTGTIGDISFVVLMTLCERA